MTANPDRGDRGAPTAGRTRPATRRLTRRQALHRLGTTVAAVGAVGLASRLGFRGEAAVTTENGPPPSMAEHQWAMVIDLRRCDGCGRCQRACNEMHDLPDDQPWLKILELRGPTGQTYYVPQPCMQCEQPPCVQVCPVGATYRTADGVTLVDPDRCIGCRMCMAACPYEARTFAWEQRPEFAGSPAGPTPEFPVPQRVGTVAKCVFCVHDIRYGKLPACVERCHRDAIWIGDFVTDIATNSARSTQLSKLIEENDAFRLREELGTHPRIYYIAGHGQRGDLDDEEAAG